MQTNLTRSVGNHKAAVLDSFYNGEFFYKIFNFGKFILKNLNWFKIKKNNWRTKMRRGYA